MKVSVEPSKVPTAEKLPRKLREGIRLREKKGEKDFLNGNEQN